MSSPLARPGVYPSHFVGTEQRCGWCGFEGRGVALTCDIGWICGDASACALRMDPPATEVHPSMSEYEGWPSTEVLAPTMTDLMVPPETIASSVEQALRSPYDPNPPAKAKAIDGWVYCETCSKPQLATGHECPEVDDAGWAVHYADRAMDLEHELEEARKSHGRHHQREGELSHRLGVASMRAEVAESLLMAMAFEHGRTLCARVARGEEDGVPFCAPLRAPRGCVFCDSAREVKP